MYAFALGRRRLAALALALSACGPSRPPAPAGAPAASAHAEPAPAKPARDDSNKTAEGADADVVVNQALAGVAGLRQLKARGPVRGKVIGRNEMVDYVRRQLRREIPERVIIAQNELLFALGTVSESFDYEKSLLELMGSQLAGFYDPEDKTMYLGRDLVGVERDATLAHELVHALQDQHYDLGRRIKFREDATDEQSATHALAEGDATSAMLDHVLVARGLKAIDVGDEVIALEARGAIEMAPDTANVPSILKRSVVSPYVDGLLFVNWLRRRGGWAAVDGVWRDPPTTTEQLLHPEKLVSKEKAETIAVPAAATGGPAEAIYRDVLGEQSVRLLFEEWMPRKAAIEAASDWSGDRIVVLKNGKTFALAWHVRYDTEASATRGAHAFARGILRKPEMAAHEHVASDEASRAMKKGSTCRERAAAGPFAVVRKGREVSVVAGPYERAQGGPKSAGACAAALAWATAIAGQK